MEALVVISEKERLNETNINTDIEYCKKLFSIEDKVKEFDHETTFTYRTEESKHSMSDYFKQLKSIEDKVISKLLIALDVKCSLNQQSHIGNYLVGERLEIPSHRWKRSIKSIFIRNQKFHFL